MSTNDAPAERDGDAPAERDNETASKGERDSDAIEERDHDALAERDDTGGILADDWLADLRAIPWGWGIVAGGATWFLGYVLTASLFYVGPAAIRTTSQSARLKQIGYLFYNAHFVDGLITASTQLAVAGGRRINLLLEASNSSIPIPVYFAIPIIALLGIGVLLGLLIVGPTTDPTDAGLAGVAMALGYVAVAFLGTAVVVRTTANGAATFAPDRLQTAAFCFAYPFVFGTIGCLLGSRYDRG